ncbi:MAG: Rne/Rng family ribonuclease [Clostridia bacterium]|nr:Rne/Rng family ribonuclease [Clostridia bacterium]
MSKKTLYFDCHCGYIISAVTENGLLSEFAYEKISDGSIIGNVYKGRVETVLPGMQAAFINCGLERNCYLSAEELPDCDRYGDEPSAVFPELKEGDEILVQVTKAPVGKKGAKVTVHPSFVGKCLIYMPETPFIGVSRKIADDELRKNLAFCAERLKSPNEGLVARTAAPYARREQLETEFKYLKNLYAEVKQAFKTAAVGELLHTDFSLPVRVLRDTLSNDIESVIVGDKALKESIDKIVKMYPTQRRLPVKLHDTGRDMLEETGIAEQITAVSSNRAELENGAYLIIEKCEALTVIDVNTGKYTGDDSLEHTVYYTNVLAAREIARQVRLRNIGGIVVVDFIDMHNAAHKKALCEELERALSTDKAKCAVAPMSRFGLVEFTRKRTGTSPASLLVKPCKHCKGTGRGLTHEFIIFGLRAKLMELVLSGQKELRIDMNADVLNYLLKWRECLNDLNARLNGATVYAVPHRTYNEEQINIRPTPFDIPTDAVKLV